MNLKNMIHSTLPFVVYREDGSLVGLCGVLGDATALAICVGAGATVRRLADGSTLYTESGTTLRDLCTGVG